jgi:hypothetical protein
MMQFFNNINTNLAFLVFIKAVKSLALATALLPLTGCAVAIGLIFSSLLQTT